MVKTHGKLYEPQIPPEREILKEHRALLDAMQGTNRMMRMGEQYYVTCRCRKHVVTSDVREADKFALSHWVGCR